MKSVQFPVAAFSTSPSGLGIAAALALASLPGGALAGDTPKLHPAKAACIDYELSGQMQSGTVQRCHRDYGYEQYEIRDVTINVAGFGQTQREHVITIGDRIYTIDLTTDTGTRMRNPMYDKMVAALEDDDATAAATLWLSELGFTANGDTKQIAGHKCRVYESSMAGTVCLTDEMLMLEQTVMGMVTTATDVSMGAEGDAANYRLHETVTLTDGPAMADMPDMSSLPEGMQEMMRSLQGQ